MVAELFVFYGSLKRGAKAAPGHISLDQAGGFLGGCRFRARMVDIGGYPGVLEGDGICQGELYRLDDLSVLHDIDVWEDCDMQDASNSLYQRRLSRFFNGPSGLEEGKAWIYWYAKDGIAFPEIKSGCWPLTQKLVQSESCQDDR